MSTVGPNRPSATADDTSSGTWSLGSKANLTDSNIETATAGSGTNGFSCYYVVATGYSMGVPAGATINGITVDMYAWRSGPSGSVTSTYLVKGGTVQTGGSEKHPTVITTHTHYTLGGSADLWGNTWTDTDVNASNFGLAFQVIGFAMGYAQVGDITITVDYTAAGGGSVARTSLLTLSVG